MNSKNQIQNNAGNLCMPYLKFDGMELYYEREGKEGGDPVFLVHGSIFANGLSNLLHIPLLSNNFKLISYDRRGYGKSTHLGKSFSVRDEAEDLGKLIKCLESGPVHVVGHSYGGLIALQLAVDSSDIVGTVTLLEPALLSLLPTGPEILDGMSPAIQMYESGNKYGALEVFMKALSLDINEIKSLPKRDQDQILKDLDTLFLVEFEQVRSWKFTKKEAAKIKSPVLSIVGGVSTYPSKQIDQILKNWLPQTETVIVPRATHMIHMTNLESASGAIADFLRRHQRLHE